MKDRTATIEHHPLKMFDGLLAITGYEAVHPEDCICFEAKGSHFLNYGIADHSLLWACTSAPVSDGDLVVCFENGHPQVCLYTRSTHTAQEGVPTIHSKKGIYAKVLGAFSLYE